MTKKITFEADPIVSAYLSAFGSAERSDRINEMIRACLGDLQNAARLEDMERKMVAMKARMEEVYGVTIE